MATERGVSVTVTDDSLLAVWAAGATTDTGKAVDVSKYPNISFQAVGDATTVAMLGSNNGTNFYAIDGGQTITLASQKILSFVSGVRQVSFLITGGSSTIVTMLAKK